MTLALHPGLHHSEATWHALWAPAQGRDKTLTALCNVDLFTRRAQVEGSSMMLLAKDRTIVFSYQVPRGTCSNAFCLTMRLCV